MIRKQRNMQLLLLYYRSHFVHIMAHVFLNYQSAPRSLP